MIERWTSPAQRRWAFWLCVAAVLLLALMRPVQHMPTTGWDKANHVLAFGVLTLLGCLAYPGRTARIVLALFAYGVLIEVLQSFTGYRSAEVLDLLADAVGLAVGWRLMLLLRRFDRPAPDGAP
jgi:VanZ family protein